MTRSTRTRSKLLRLTAGLLTATLVASACGGDDDTGDADPDAPAEEGAPEQDAEPEGEVSTGDAPEDEAQPTATEPPTVPTPAGTLRFGTFTGAQTFDPHQAQLTLAAYMSPVYDTLVRQDPDGELVPGLATEWERVDAQTWRFTLRDGVTFHDGTPFDADAVRANLERARDTETNPQRGEFRDIAEVVVEGPLEVSVVFSVPHPDFATAISNLAGSMVSPAAFGEGLQSEPVGTGGWRFDADASQPGTQYVFVLNEDYWDPDGQLVERVEVTVLSDTSARVNALRTGQVDVIDAVQAVALPQLESDGFDIVSTPQMSLFIVGDRNGEIVPALGDERVRQALNHAMNRESFIDNLQGGRGAATAALWPVESPWATGQNTDAYAFDPDRARDLLAEAGYADGVTIPVPVFGVTQTSNEAAAQMLNEVGVELELVPVEPGTAGPLFRQREFPMVWAPFVVISPHSFWTTWVSADGGWNPFGVDTSDIDGIALQAAATLDIDEQLELYAEMERMILDQGIFMVVSQTDLLAAIGDAVAGETVMRIGERMPVPHGLAVES